MAGSDDFAGVLGFAANIQNMHEQFFEGMAMAGATAITVKLGGRFVSYVYDQTQKLREHEESTPPPSSPADSEMSAQHPRNMAEEFENVTPDVPPPMQPQGQVAIQVNRLESGQQLLPVDNGDEDGNADAGQEAHKAYLSRVQAGKRPTDRHNTHLADDRSKTQIKIPGAQSDRSYRTN